MNLVTIGRVEKGNWHKHIHDYLSFLFLVVENHELIRSEPSK